ncbi:nucleoside recognition domain-containing protein [Mucilaginibacter sp. E4BP6]|uniref:nucleoside recognition domain-containing protein n=1 Tax=Mucilaginibacter sp. E4BP6 TaxID=2723089 RepID=UPI0015C74C86|nr:nucleoside recognition domain-containing protein [Mucilaginibacter sp. E4BP6]NYE66385.1 spore maturation protein SpmA [Mucilaginibacter sp. E4BP6]
MTLNYIWVFFFLIAFGIGLVKLIFFGDTEIFKLMADGTLESAQSAVMQIALPLIGIMTLWLGIMRIGEKAGAVNFLSRIVGPFFNKLFPEVPKNHPAIGQMMLNFSANLLGLDNAATPLGLKAMSDLQELNQDKETASNSQIMFLVLHASGLTILPIAIIAQRAIFHSKDPTDIFIPCIVATYVATVAGLIVVSIKQKINLFDKVVLSWLLGISAFLGLLIWYFTAFLNKSQISTFSGVFSNMVYIGIPVVFILGGLRKKINVFEAFIEGAKEGFEVSVKIMPYLVGLLVAVSLFRTSGALTYLGDGFKWFFSHFNMDTRFVDVLPIAFLRPLSGSGARALMLDNLKIHGPDSFIGHMSSVLYGTADTTFYIVALYFGAVNIKKTRYTVPAMLIADFAGIVTAILISYLFFG